MRADITTEQAPGSFQIGVDVGGTFTDLVLLRANAPMLIVKVPSVLADPAEGVVEALSQAAGRLSLSVRELLVSTTLFVHGTTIGTNTLLERKGARVSLLTSDGFRDSLEIRRGYRPDPWDHRTAYPEVLVPRYLRQPVSGRLDRTGTQVQAISSIDVEHALERFAAEGVESIAICLYNSYISAAHEDEVAALLDRHWSGDWVCCSSRLAPIIGEYERSSSAVLNAYIAPRTVRYLQRLDQQLAEQGLAIPVLLIQNNGGAISIRQIDRQPATLLLSGPAAGVGTLNYLARETGNDNLISMEIGGTSCDVILLRAGQAATTAHLDIDGYHLALPSVDVHTVGAGGGTITGVDAAGLLFVGPQGAGASPGPACYGLGGEQATITDTQLVLGRLAPGPFAGDQMTLNRDLACNVIKDKLADPLGLSIEEAAIGAMRLMDQKLLYAVQRISVERGHDPALFTLVAGGGAGPLHVSSVGRMLGCRRLLVPRLSGAFCALGMLNSNVRHEYLRVYFAPLERVNLGDVRVQLDELQAEAADMLRAEGFEPKDTRFQCGCSLRYHGQQWDVQVNAEGLDFNPDDIKRRFEDEHQRLFGHVQPEGVIEITQLQMIAIGLVTGSASVSLGSQDNGEALLTTRSVWIDTEHGWMDTPVYDGARLRVGDRLTGPALINEKTSTVLLGAGDQLELDISGNYMIQLPVNQARTT